MSTQRWDFVLITNAFGVKLPQMIVKTFLMSCLKKKWTNDRLPICEFQKVENKRNKKALISAWNLKLMFGLNLGWIWVEFGYGFLLHSQINLIWYQIKNGSGFQINLIWFSDEFDLVFRWILSLTFGFSFIHHQSGIFFSFQVIVFHETVNELLWEKM